MLYIIDDWLSTLPPVVFPEGFTKKNILVFIMLIFRLKPPETLSDFVKRMYTELTQKNAFVLALVDCFFFFFFSCMYFLAVFV